MVICSICGASHSPAIPGSKDQGYGCSAEVARGVIVGHYGSVEFDMTALRFKGAPLPDGTLICDTCLLGMLAQGTIETIEPESREMPHEAVLDLHEALLLMEEEESGDH